MGTRNLTVIVSDGKIKVSQYGQWDGYFINGRGEDFAAWVLNTLKGKTKDETTHRIERFKEKVDVCSPVTKEYLEGIQEALKPFLFSDDNKSGFAIPLNIILDVFHRDTSVDILNIIKDICEFDFTGCGKNFKFPVLVDTDTGMIEYAYVIDLDKQKVYFLSSHEFNSDEMAKSKMDTKIYTDVIQKTYVDEGGLDCFFSCDINKLPSVKTLKNYVSKIEK